MDPKQKGKTAKLNAELNIHKNEIELLGKEKDEINIESKQLQENSKPNQES